MSSSPYNLRSRRRVNESQNESPSHSPSKVDENAKVKKTTTTAAEGLGAREWLGIFGIVVVIILTASYCSKILPTPLGPSAENDRFSEVRARPFLERISAVGPKPSGSHACEVEARKIILDELHTIEKALDGSHHRLEIQEQRPSGCYDIDRFDVDGFTICYKNVTNIIVRLGDKKRDWKQSQTSVLINCHYDTWPSAPGTAFNNFMEYPSKIHMFAKSNRTV